MVASRSWGYLNAPHQPGNRFACVAGQQIPLIQSVRQVIWLLASRSPAPGPDPDPWGRSNPPPRTRRGTVSSSRVGDGATPRAVTRSDSVPVVEMVSDVLGPSMNCSGRGQTQLRDGMLNELNLLVGRIDEDDRDLGASDLQYEARQPGAGAKVDQTQRPAPPREFLIDRRQQAQGVGDKARVDALGFADGGQVEPLVPAKEQVAVIAQLALLDFREVAQQLRANAVPS